MTNVFIVIQTWDCADDGFTIESVFNTKEKAIKYIKKEHPEVQIDTDYYGKLDDTSYVDKSGDRFTNERRYDIHEFKLR